MIGHVTNQERADRAWQALITYVDNDFGGSFYDGTASSENIGTAIQDLIGDLGHLFDRHHDPDVHPAGFDVLAGWGISGYRGERRYCDVCGSLDDCPGGRVR